MISSIKLSAFGKNDIRGIYGDDVTEDLFYYVGKAYVKYVCENTGKSVDEIWLSVARDARLHSEALSKSLIRGIVTTGANVVNIGLAPTPLGYYSEFSGIDKDITNGAEIDGALIITASHNPKEYNGLKMTFNKSSLDETEIKKVKALTEQLLTQRELGVRHGMNKEFDLVSNYIEKMRNSFPNVGKGIKVVVDSANATGGIVAPELYRAIGCDVVELYSEPDGNFPNHHPNPSDEKTLTDLKNKVVEEKADLGIAFDGDSDRIGVVDSQGVSMTGDKLLLIYALDVIDTLKRRGEVPKVVSEVKCSQVLYDTINKAGGEAIMCKTGHGYIKSKMKEVGAILAGEMSGHTFFKDRYYGFDDAIYAGCRIIEIIAKKKQEELNFRIESLLEPFNKVYTSQEVRYKCPNEMKKQVLSLLTERVMSNKKIFDKEYKEVNTLDGMRIIFDDGFAMIRQSNTEPVFTIRFEAGTKEMCEHYQNVMLSELDKAMEESRA